MSDFKYVGRIHQNLSLSDVPEFGTERFFKIWCEHNYSAAIYDMSVALSEIYPKPISEYNMLCRVCHGKNRGNPALSHLFDIFMARTDPARLREVYQGMIGGKYDAPNGLRPTKFSSDQQGNMLVHYPSTENTPTFSRIVAPI